MLKHALAVATLSAFLASTNVAAAAGAVDGARQMSPADVQTLYSGRTWVWEDGAAYFAPDGSFLAWSRPEDFATVYATGQWMVTGNGGMCFDAMWYYRGGSDRDRTCFNHRAANGTVFQRKSTSGEWYVFQAASPAEEQQEIRTGDYVTPMFRQNRPDLLGMR